MRAHFPFKVLAALAIGVAGCIPEPPTQMPTAGNVAVDRRSSAPEAGGTFGSVCGFSELVASGSPARDGYVDVPANHPKILYFGRVDCSTPSAPSFAFPGISIRMRFEGDGVDLRLKDYGTPTAVNYYDVLIDRSASQVLQVSPAKEVYSVGRKLGPGPHTVELFKRIESAPGGATNAGKATFLGFRIPQGGTVLPLLPRPRRVEFIGDSITCGYGNEISTGSPDNYHYSTEGSNAAKAWGAVVARALNAEYMAVAYSGRGVYRNFQGLPGDTLPQMYLKSLPDDANATPWNLAAWSPDVIVVNLGTNDFSAVPTDEGAFKREYVAFLGKLRSYYPSAPIIVAIGPQMSDDYPQGLNAWTRIRDDLTQVVDARKAASDTNLYKLVLPPQTGPWGQDWHPTAAEHQTIAAQAVALIKQIKGW